MTDLSEMLLKTIAAGGFRVYSHEARAMAIEILRWREAAKNAASPRPLPLPLPHAILVP